MRPEADAEACAATTVAPSFEIRRYCVGFLKRERINGRQPSSSGPPGCAAEKRPTSKLGVSGSCCGSWRQPGNTKATASAQRAKPRPGCDARIVDTRSERVNVNIIGKAVQRSIQGMQLSCAHPGHAPAARPASHARVRAAACMYCMTVIGTALAQASPLVPAFSQQAPDAQVIAGWSSITFRKAARPTQYSLVREGDSVVVHAHAQASASGLTHAVHLDAKTFPILSWRWKIDHVLERADIARKQGDDYAARVYVTFDLDASRASF